MFFDLARLIKSADNLNILGINSGTSADGLDLVLVRFGGAMPRVLNRATYLFESDLKARIIAAGESDFNDGVAWLRLDADLGAIYGQKAKRFIARSASKGHRTDLIAMHGQTVRHLPGNAPHKITCQIGDAARVARINGRPVVSDFRRSDTAAGGEGAPLSPILHEALFRHERRWRAIVNVGGIANVTVLPPQNARTLPFAADCGPGNMLIDRAAQHLHGLPYDKDGRIAMRGKPDDKVVRWLLSGRFFARKPPKSTGREDFGENRFRTILRKMKGALPEDIISTLTQLTVQGIAIFITRFVPQVDELYLCGGGARNQAIKEGLDSLLPGARIATTAELSFDPDYLEALLWAYLAWHCISSKPVCARNYTGAKSDYIPGKICMP